MAIQQFLATVRSDGALVLPREAREKLNLKSGEAVLISLDRDATAINSQDVSDAFDLTEFFAEADAVERQPSIPTVPQSAEKQHKLGLKLPC